ncbi:MAG: CBS domain-containing protein [Candidatus Yanofskybacteria bacterium]|nr:CBS domain-containing protein [Candidatus Yanofskybacteria bacterium]
MNTPFAILPLEKALRCKPGDTLDKAFSQMESSHNVVLVYDGGEFCGILSPAYCLFQKTFSYSTKAKSCLIQPPRITRATPLPKIAEFMNATGIYELPVFDENKNPVGLVLAQELVRALLRDKELLGKATEYIVPASPIVAPFDTASVKDLYHSVFREKKGSRVVLLGPSGSVEAIVTRRDIQKFLTKPTTRQRFKSGGGKGPARNFAFGVEKEGRLDILARECATRDVLMGSAGQDKKALLARMEKMGKNSILLVKGNRYPVGIISMRTVLSAVARALSEEETYVVLANSAHLSDAGIASIRKTAERFAKKIAKKSSLTRVELVIKEAKTREQRPAEYEIRGEAFFSSGRTLAGKASSRNLMPALRQVFDKLEEQERRKPS